MKRTSPFSGQAVGLCRGCLCLALATLSSSTALLAATFYVAPDGKDANPGTRREPFASFERVQQAVRAERSAHPTQGVTVTFRPGTYELERPLEFTAADSGVSAEAPIIYQAEPGSEVVFSGGRQLKGWQADSKLPGVWKTRVADPNSDSKSAWRFEQLWVNDRRAIRARAPNYWEFELPRDITEEPPATEGGRAKHKFSVKPEALAKLKGLDGDELHNVQIVVFHKWDTTREWLESASPDEGILTTFGARMQSWNSMARDSLFYLENFLAALDSPGEWFLDRDGWLYYRPRPGEDMATARAVGSRTERFLVFRGEIGSSTNWVHDLRFKGLAFRYGDFRVPADGLRPGQAAMNIDRTAIVLDGARGIHFQNCAVEHIGTTAFWFRHACRDCVVEHTRMFDLGIEGVRIGEEAIVPEPVRTGGIKIDNCIIQSAGRLLPHAVGVWIGQSSDNAVTHCDIGDLFYTAVSVGWRWGYDESAGKRNRIEFNHLHHLGYRILSDMGGVYTLGPSEGTVVSHNVIHDVYATRYGGWGLYPDEGSTGILYENNLVYDVQDGCIHQHYGKENIFRNNILAFSQQGQLALTRAEPHLSFTFEHNIVYWEQGQLLGYAGWQNGAKVVLRNNLYWCAGGKPFDFAGKSWEQWRSAGNDEGSIIADPLFVNAQSRDFRLRPESPAKKLGFKPFDLSQAGVYGDPKWKKLAVELECPKPYVVPEAESRR